MTKQQELEKYYFDKFMLLYEIPDGKIIHSDCPDVIIAGKQKIGIEITHHYIKPGKDKRCEQRQKDIRKNILKSSQKKYLSSEEPNIALSVAFNGKLEAKNNEMIANKIAKLAININKYTEGVIEANLYEHIPEIEFVHYAKTNILDLKWDTVQSYDLLEISKERLQNIIDEKNEKCEKYEICDSYWLLIVMDYFDPAQYQNLNILDDFSSNESCFTKIIILVPELNQIIEVKQ